MNTEKGESTAITCIKKQIMAFQYHMVIFPFMSQGHTLPLLDLSKALSRRGLKVTIITTPANSPSIYSVLLKYPEIHIKEIPFPLVKCLPNGCENTAQLPSMSLLYPFLTATRQLQQPFEEVLREMSQAQDLPICVISDSFLNWTNASCHLFNVPRLVFNGMTSFSAAVRKSLFVHQTHKQVKSDAEPLHVPGILLHFPLTKADLPNSLKEMDNNLLSRFFLEADEADEANSESWGLIINSFMELEADYVVSLESLFSNGAKAWCLGPMFLYNEAERVQEDGPSNQWIEWLKEHATRKSVMYVSFGTQVDLSNKQLDEIAFGLEMSEQLFIWVVRSKGWHPPNGLEERVKGRGLIVREWVDQRSILAHDAIGGFLSHCGWNSVLESLSMGVPILACPMIAEQTLNAKFVVEELKVGKLISVESAPGEDTVLWREVICEGVRELMAGNTGRRARERAKKIGQAAKRAVQEGGSSRRSLSDLIEKLSGIK